MEYSKKRAKVINANVLAQQIEWDLIGAAAGAECIWFGPHLQTVLSRAVRVFLIATLTASAQHPAQSLQILSATRKILKWPFKEHIMPVPKVLFSEV